MRQKSGQGEVCRVHRDSHREKDQAHKTVAWQETPGLIETGSEFQNEMQITKQSSEAFKPRKKEPESYGSQISPPKFTIHSTRFAIPGATQCGGSTSANTQRSQQPREAIHELRNGISQGVVSAQGSSVTSSGRATVKNRGRRPRIAVWASGGNPMGTCGEREGSQGSARGTEKDRCDVAGFCRCRGTRGCVSWLPSEIEPKSAKIF